MTHTTSSRRLGAALAMLALFLAACGDSAGSGSAVEESSVSTLKPPVAPIIESFTAEPMQVTEGQSTVLSWVVNDPTATAKVSPLAGTVQGNSLTVTPVLTTTYTLQVTNSVGGDTASLTIFVGNGDPAAPVGTNPTTTAQWVNAASNLAGMSSDCGNLSYMSSYPGKNMVIANVAKQGLFVAAYDTTDWLPLGTGAGSDPIINRAQAIIYDPDHPETFWESGTYGEGVFRTDDAGATFRRLGDIEHVDVVGVDLSDSEHKTLLAGRHEDTKLRLSTDGGNNWTDISSSLPPEIAFTHTAVVLDSQTFLLGTTAFDAGAPTAVWRSTDQGKSWTQVFDRGASGVPLITADAIYWTLGFGNGLIKSTDGGATWENIGLPGNASTVPSLVMLPGNRLASVSGAQVVMSDDMGVTWRPFGPLLPWDASGLTYSPERQAFYAWHFDCANTGDNPIKEDSIVRLDLAPPPG